MRLINMELKKHFYMESKEGCILVSDLIEWMKEYECPHHDMSCNCCDGITQLRKLIA